MAYPARDPFRQAIRGGLAITYLVDAFYGGLPVASCLMPTGGSITDTTTPGVRRLLNLELAPEPGLFNKLAPVGTQLRVRAQVMYQNRSTVDIPMGVFDVDSQSLDEGGGKIGITAPDKWAKIQRARFLWPTGPELGVPVTYQISQLIRAALGPNEPVNVLSTSTATVPSLTWEKDRDRAVIDLAESIGAWVYFDRLGVATVADIPTSGAAADWLVDSSAAGVMTALTRQKDRSKSYNIVVVESSASSGSLFSTEYVWDFDPASPTFAGTNPGGAIDAGPFGVVPYFYDTPILSSQDAARKAGETLLARGVGLASQVSLGQVPNPAVDAFDVIDVLPPKERYDMDRIMERHLVDVVTHPLGEGEQTITGRSIRL